MSDLRISTSIYVVLNALGLLLLRAAMKQIGEADTMSLASLFRPDLVAGVVAYGASFVVFIGTLRYHELSVVFPLYSGLAYAAAMLAAWLLLDEVMNGWKLLGLMAVGIGVVLLQH